MGRRTRRKYVADESDSENYSDEDSELMVPYSLVLGDTDSKILNLLESFRGRDIVFKWLTLSDIWDAILSENQKSKSYWPPTYEFSCCLLPIVDNYVTESHVSESVAPDNILRPKHTTPEQLSAKLYFKIKPFMVI